MNNLTVSYMDCRATFEIYVHRRDKTVIDSSLYPESVIVNTTKNQVSVEIAKKQISLLGVQWGPYTSYTFKEEPIEHYLEISTLPEEIKGITYKYYRIADEKTKSRFL